MNVALKHTIWKLCFKLCFEYNILKIVIWIVKHTYFYKTDIVFYIPESQWLTIVAPANTTSAAKTRTVFLSIPVKVFRLPAQRTLSAVVPAGPIRPSFDSRLTTVTCEHSACRYDVDTSNSCLSRLYRFKEGDSKTEYRSPRGSIRVLI